MYKHWTEALDAALTATYILSVQLNISMDEAREMVVREVDISDAEALDEYLWFTCFGSTVRVPYKQTLDEVLAEQGFKLVDGQIQQI